MTEELALERQRIAARYRELEIIDRQTANAARSLDLRERELEEREADRDAGGDGRYDLNEDPSF